MVVNLKCLILGFKNSVMKFPILFFFFIILFTSCNHSQEEYKSSARDAYFDSVSKSWKLDKLEAKKPLEIQNDFISIVPIRNPSTFILKNENYYYDSLAKAKKINVQDENGLTKLFDEVEKTKIGPIAERDVIKFGNLKTNKAIIYVDDKFNNCFEKDYWIAISNNNGRNWKRYFTGLSVNKNYYFKSNSKLPLWKNSNTLQVEAAKVKKTSDRILSSKSEEFGVVRDSLAIELAISKIILDSDNDGLTDILEERMLLNSNSPDSDGDGIIDSKDKNPRFKSKKTAKSILYETLMGKYSFKDNSNYQIDLSSLPQKLNIYPKTTNSIFIFVTDDIDIKGLVLNNATLIVMTSEEYKAYKLRYPFQFKVKDVSKMFLCDNEKNVYVVHTSECMSTHTYLVKKNEKGWEVSSFGMTII